MNRTLKRPMFRIGGSAGTGITSGLDRTGYAGNKPTFKEFLDGLSQEQKQMQQENLFKEYQNFLKRQQVAEQKTMAADGGRIGYANGTPNFQFGGLPGFLTGLGLNLLATPPQGNIFQTTAVAAKGPFEQFQAQEMARASTAEDRAFKEKLLERQIAADKEIAAMKQKDQFFAAQTPEEQFRERAKIYSESTIPVIKNNATDLANFEVKNRNENYVQLNFEYDNSTRKFEPDFRSVPEGALTYDPGKGVAYRMTRRDDGILVPIPLNPFTLEPLENIDGSES